MTVICYVRPWNEKQFRLITEHAFPDQKIHLISDFPKHAPFFLQENLVAQFKKEKKSKVSLLIPEHVVYDMIQRCRLLRNINQKDAHSLINGCYKVIKDIFAKTNPSYVLGLTVDSYVVDIIRYVTEEQGKKYIGLVPSFINGYCRLSARGEYNSCRKVTDEEINRVLDRLINKQEKPVFLNQFKSEKDMKDNWTKAKLRKFLRLWYMIFMRFSSTSYRYCYHHWHSYILARIPGEKINPQLFEDFPINQNLAKTCYLPLQYFPECTVDYWVKDLDKIDYYKVLFNVLKEVAELGITVYVKEHPNCLSIRPKNFYKKIKSIPHVKLIKPSINSVQLIKNTDFTLVWTGTAGIEAALLGKPVVHLGEPYYVTDHPCFMSWDDFKARTFELTGHVNCEQCMKGIMKFLLEGALNVSFQSDPRSLSPRELDSSSRLIGLELKKILS
ncbi:hypothetical protein FOG18_07250 [Legionella israelensis]|uniref:capsular polysaccharide export protein, LipB/KpsS family n=1 Tax=Legionella israelensis TaxID=454 RepID=UPI00117E0B2D|nr:hypothetical protein [Legionella israelensis]QDP72367.1 hypothetical protein FOG18_07250 [Legionella israelensis]